MTKFNVIQGKYWYTRPDWIDCFPVVIYRDVSGRLVVRFTTGAYPVDLESIPLDAEFTIRKEE